jgi:hypothetical protein
MKWQQRPVKKQNAPRNDLTADFVRSILDYDSETGILTWKYRENAKPDWNTRYAGKKTGSINGQGYQIITINRSQYYAHRLAWLIQTGEWPQFEIDHEDGNPANNKWSNLRDATHQENGCNLKIDIQNTSGVAGVRWNKSRQRWQTYIGVNRKLLYLGLFESFEDAVAARQTAELKYFGEFRRKRS